MSNEIVPVDPRGEGNNRTSPKKQISPAIGWCFTFNNYTEEIVLKFQEIIKTKCKMGFFNKEVAPTTGTPHLQGYVQFHKKNRPCSVFPIGGRWVSARGNQDHNFKYCAKEANETIEQMTFSTGYKIKKPLKIIKELRPWQSNVLNIIKEEPEDRRIVWIYEEEGNVGKSALCKYLIVNENALFIDEGKKSDLINLVFNTDMDACELVVIDIPRDNKNISYKTMESIKNGMICNTKYETGSKVFNAPHVIVFANFYPEVAKMSLDRWEIYRITDLELIADEIRTTPIEYNDEDKKFDEFVWEYY